MAGPYYNPPINSSGVITLLEPFAGQCAENVPYTVAGVSTFADLAADGHDPYTMYYAANNIPPAKFDEDVLAGVCIISLRSASGDWVRVPNSYLANAPVATGIPYATMLVGIKLGALPESLNLLYYMDTVKELAADLLGVTNAEVMPIKNSTTVYLTLDDSKAIEAARSNVMSEVITDYAKLRISEAARLKAIARIAELEQYILDRSL